MTTYRFSIKVPEDRYKKLAEETNGNEEAVVKRLKETSASFHIITPNFTNLSDSLWKRVAKRVIYHVHAKKTQEIDPEALGIPMKPRCVIDAYRSQLASLGIGHAYTLLEEELFSENKSISMLKSLLGQDVDAGIGATESDTFLVGIIQPDDNVNKTAETIYHFVLSKGHLDVTNTIVTLKWRTPYNPENGYDSEIILYPGSLFKEEGLNSHALVIFMTTTAVTLRGYITRPDEIYRCFSDFVRKAVSFDGLVHKAESYSSE